MLNGKLELDGLSSVVARRPECAAGNLRTTIGRSGGTGVRLARALADWYT